VRGRGECQMGYGEDDAPRKCTHSARLMNERSGKDHTSPTLHLRGRGRGRRMEDITQGNAQMNIKGPRPRE